MTKEIKIARLREALEAMVWQFAYRRTRDRRLILWAGGDSALKDAFRALGWADPHYLARKDARKLVCDIYGCYWWGDASLEWDNLYLHLCDHHSVLLFKGQPRPRVKKYAIEREVRRKGGASFLEEIQSTPGYAKQLKEAFEALKSDPGMAAEEIEEKRKRRGLKS